VDSKAEYDLLNLAQEAKLSPG